MLTRWLLGILAVLWLMPSPVFAESTVCTTLASGAANRCTLIAVGRYTAAQTDAAIVTVSAGTKIVVTGATFTCSAANSVNVDVDIGFGLTTTPTTTQSLISFPGVPAGGGVREQDNPLGIGADGEDVRITMTVPTGGSCRAKITYFTTATGS